jgi:aminoglycoside phosphotransferase (APT) family kinase protein
VVREFRVVDALQQTKVPVAPTIANCTDTSVLGVPFTVVGFVPGITMPTQHELDEITDSALNLVRRSLVRVLVDLHDVPDRDVGLADFGRPEGFFARQVARWRRQWSYVAGRELADVDRLYTVLSNRLPVQQRHTLVHGDYRIDNTLLHPHHVSRVLAVVDWEMSTLGDPLTDVATMCAYQHIQFDHVVGEPAASTSCRWPSSDQLAQDYATLSGADLTNFGMYLGLAYFMLAVIAEGISAPPPRRRWTGARFRNGQPSGTWTHRSRSGRRRADLMN